MEIENSRERAEAISKDLFKLEIEKIKSEDIRQFVEDALGEVDPMFWVAAASSSGKFHPIEDNGVGGLVRHVIKGVAVAEQYARRAMFTDRERDMVIAAMLLHDTCKDGVVWTGKTDYTHGLIAAGWLEKFELEDEGAKREIINAVRYHMAPWCYAVDPYQDRQYTREEMQANWAELARAMTAPSRIEVAVQQADYWSSRKEMSFLPGRSVMYDNMVHDTPEEWMESMLGEYGNS